MASRNDRRVRGLRTPLRTSTVLGRLSPGDGDVEMLSTSELASFLNLETEQIQDLVGAMMTDGTTIDFTYNDPSGTITAEVTDGSLTAAKFANFSASTLFGRRSGSAGTPEEITLGSGLSMSASGELSATGGGSSPVTTEGDIIVGNGDGDEARLAIGSNGQVLTSNGTTASWQTPAGGGGGAVEFVASIDVSNQATADFTGFNASDYDYYIFAFGNLIPATDNVTLRVRTSTDGGSNYDSGGSDYAWNVVARDPFSLNNAIETSDSGGDSSVQISFPVGSNAFEDGVSGTLQVMFPHLTRKTLMTAEVVSQDADGQINIVSAAGGRLASADVDALRFLFSSGNLESGTITMYGVKNSA